MSTEATSVHHHVFDTAIGPCGVAWNARGLTGVQLPEKDRAATERRLAAKAGSAGAAEPPPWVATVVADIKRYLAGEPVDFARWRSISPASIRSARSSTKPCARWPGADTTTYGELARQLGSTDWEGARDVGEAMGRNPVPVVIPCHRVLAAGGKLGGFSAHGGAKTKAKLLALEGVHLDGGPRLPGFDACTFGPRHRSFPRKRESV